MNRKIGLLVVLASLGLMVVASTATAAPVPSAKLLSALHWRSVGPYLGGRVTSVAGIASKPNVFFAAYADGGVWKTEDYGKRWKSIWSKNLPTGVVGAIAIAPSNAKVIYAGTGDPSFRNTILTGDGIYKSTDGGKTWKHIGLAKTHIISWIIVDPTNPNIVYVAAMGHAWAPNPQRGVYKTTDGGKTWKKVLYVNAKTGAITLAMDPANPDVLYATMWQAYRRPWTLSSGGPGSGIYKTTDGGATWTNLSRNSGLPSGSWGKVTVAVAPSKPNVVYALIQAKYKGHLGGLFRSSNGGRTWQVQNTSPAIVQRAFYYLRVYVDPKDPNTIYLPNVGVFVSHDGGKKLHELHPPHGDNHAFWINPNDPKLLIEGNDGGATVSADGGKSWSTEHNQPTGQFYHVDLDNEFPFHLWGAQQDRGSIESASAVPSGGIPGVWKQVVGGEMSWVVPKPGEPWVSYGSGYYSQQLKENRRISLNTNVSAWPAYKFGLPGSAQRYRYGWWYHPVLTVPGHPEEIIVGANVVLRSMDGGIHWKAISPDLTRNDKSKQQSSGGPISQDNVGEEMYDTISTIGISPVNGDVMWTGSDDGLVYVTRDGGGHWQQVRPQNLPKWSWITSIEPSQRNPGTAFLTASRYEWDDFHPYLYKTTDYGQHWTKITSGLPDNQYLTTVRQDPNAPNLLFAATSSTVYMSLDGGSHWQPLKLNLPSVRVTDIAIQPHQHAVAISTYGRAFWVLDNLQFLEQLASAKVASIQPYLFKPQQTWLVKRRAHGFGGGGGPFDNEGTNLPSGAVVFFHLPVDYHGQTPVKLSFTNAEGKLIRSYTLPVKPQKSSAAPTVVVKKPEPKKLHPGMNRFRWNLRYPTAVQIHGIYHHPLAAAKPIGPTVLPGKYYAVLDYGTTKQKQPFVVKLDPRLSTTPAQLKQRLALQMQIHKQIDDVDIAVNHALAARTALQQALASNSVSGTAARKALAGINRDIESVVDLRIQSFAGPLLFPEKVRASLSQIGKQVGYAFVAPTPSMHQVAHMYIDQAKKAVRRLKTDTTGVNVGLDSGFKTQSVN